MTTNPLNRAGEKIEWDDAGRPLVPDHPIIPHIIGDGTGPDIWRGARPVFDQAVQTAFQGLKQIVWMEIPAGEKAQQIYGPDTPLPRETIDRISHYGIALKGPLTTPVGSGLRSLNVALRQALDLYACVRPVRYIPGVPTPVRHPENMDVIIFRENTEDVYAGLEWPAGSNEAREILELINTKYRAPGSPRISEKSAIGLKPMSRANTVRLVNMAVRYAVDHDRKSVTLVHKGNIMKYTEGAFRDWGYQAAESNFSHQILTETMLFEKYAGVPPSGKIILKDRIADAMFQQLLLRPEEYDIIVTPNLNGDYLSDAAVAQVGGLGLAPGSNIGDRCAIFEATHGSAPKYAGMDRVNPGSLILSGVEMLKFMGWQKAADLIMTAIIQTIQEKIVTYDLARQMKDAREVTCSEFGEEIRKRIAQGSLTATA